MSMVPLATAKAQSRILLNAEDALVQGYLDAAEVHAQDYMNRKVYPDQAAWDADKVHLTDATAVNAETAYLAALSAIGIYPNGNFDHDAFGQPTSPTFVQTLAMNNAVETFQRVQDGLMRIVCGMVIDPTFTQAVILIAANWYENRESTLTEVGNAIELPWGAKRLLDFNRRQMGA